MMRYVLFVVLAIFVARAFWRVFDAIVEAASGRPPKGQVPDRGVQMVRDPVCGTFLLPDRAVMLAEGRNRVFFCSDTCRDEYRSRPSTDSGRPDPSAGSPRATSRRETVEGRAR